MSVFECVTVKLDMEKHKHIIGCIYIILRSVNKVNL